MVRWESGRRSDNVEDRRAMGGRGMQLGGGGILMLVLVFFLTGGDLGKVLQFFLQNNVAVQQAPPGVQRPASPEEEKLYDFARVILADTEDVWTKIFAEKGQRYRPPTLVVFSSQVMSGCGPASAAAGPFYCPADGKLYLDLEFFEELSRRFGAPGDFARAYVIAHEVGHHVQNLMGTSRRVQEMRGRLSEAEYNRLSVMLELQADFYAGVWAHYADVDRRIIEPGDIEEGINAAAAIGDDTLQKRQRGYADQESFTHGTSAQRVKWFRKGYETGDLSQGDTFDAPDL